ncbi:MAG: S-adenosylmethionine decarboxylase [Candidatus Eisenbacteria bacterium]|nr:S-adenosylmethionine decarboxylase [Candidatus Eisenbacteria bacterium]
MAKHVSPGYHVLLDVAGVPRSTCVDDAGLVKLLVAASERAGCTVINSVRYRFGHGSPDGCTAFVMLDESHVAVHSYADKGLLAVDVFVCGEHARRKSLAIVEEIRRFLPEGRFRESMLDRFVSVEDDVPTHSVLSVGEG